MAAVAWLAKHSAKEKREIELFFRVFAYDLLGLSERQPCQRAKGIERSGLISARHGRVVAVVCET